MLSFLEALVAELSPLKSKVLIQAIEKELSLLIFSADQYKTLHLKSKYAESYCLSLGTLVDNEIGVCQKMRKKDRKVVEWWVKRKRTNSCFGFLVYLPKNLSHQMSLVGIPMSAKSCKASINIVGPFGPKLVWCLEMFLVSKRVVKKGYWAISMDINFFCDRYKTQETCEKTVLVEPYSTESPSDQYKTHELCKKAVGRTLYMLKLVPDGYKTKSISEIPF